METFRYEENYVKPNHHVHMNTLKNKIVEETVSERSEGKFSK